MLGGSSPLLGLTEAQARALEAALPEYEARCFVAMRYWHPFSEQAARGGAGVGPGRVASVAAVSAVFDHDDRQSA